MDGKKEPRCIKTKNEKPAKEQLYKQELNSDDSKGKSKKSWEK